MTDFDLQSEQFQTLLAEALRAGPGSPEWHQAVRTLRASNQNVDEFTLLNQAREHLESGKSYRSVQAGPGFTRKVMDGIDSEGRRARGLPTATLIAIIGGLVIVAVAAVVIFFATRGGNAQQHAIEDLSSVVFKNRFLATMFSGNDIPPGWLKIGELPVTVAGGHLKPGAYSTSSPTTAPVTEYQTGGLVNAVPVPADSSVEVDVMLRLARAGDDGIAQLFISDTPIDAQHPTGSHELVWLFQGGQAKVFLPSGHAEGTGEKVTSAREVPVKVLLNKGLVVIESGGKRLYAGPNQLSPTEPRYIGVRFLRKAGEKWDHLGFTSIALIKP